MFATFFSCHDSAISEDINVKISSHIYQLLLSHILYVCFLQILVLREIYVEIFICFENFIFLI